MHGHGDKPYLCTYEGCERAALGCGFPRQWNLKDHMRRVHNDNGHSIQQGSGNSPSAHGNSHAAKSLKRKSKEPADSSPAGRKMFSKSAPAATATAIDADAAPKASEQPLLDQWYEHHKAIQRYVQEFNQPDAFGQLEGHSDALEHLRTMGKITHKLLVSKNSRLSQDMVKVE